MYFTLYYRERDHSSRHSSPLSVRDYDRRHSIENHIREAERRDSETRRSRSRSPLRNGPDERHRRSDSALLVDSSQDSKSEVKVKEEHKDISIIEDLTRERERELHSRERRPELRMDMKPDGLRPDGLRNDVLHHYPGLQFAPNSMLDRSRMPNPYLTAERLPHPALWNPFERTLDQHRLELQFSVEKERDRILQQRFANPLAPMIDHERLREQQDILIRERMMRERESIERMAALDRHRVQVELEQRAGIPPLRPAEPFMGALGPAAMYMARSASPMVNSHGHPHNSAGVKTNSPSTSMGVPPPLIPSGSVPSHNNSPTANKPKATPSPLTNSQDTMSAKDKLEASTNGHDSEAQSR